MRNTSKLVVVGQEGSGKSYLMAIECYQNLYRNHHWQNITGIPRPIRGNLAWSRHFYDLAASLSVPVIPWHNIAELEDFSECDLYIDELGTYFDSRVYKDLPLSIRLWLAQAEKMGVEIVGAAQDYGQVDKSFRRLCKEVIEVQKRLGNRRPMKTAPPVRGIWGVGLKWKLNPKSFEGEQVDMKESGLLQIPTPFIFRKKYIDLFDTSQRVAKSPPVPLQHVARFCPIPDCRYHSSPQVSHV